MGPGERSRADASPRTRSRLQNPQILSNLIATPLLAQVDIVRRLPENLPAPTPKPSVSGEVITARFTGMKLRLIPAGTFMMGSPDDDKDARDHEKPAREIKITAGFYLGQTEVTQGQYKAVTGENPSGFKGPDDLPVEEVSWLDAVKYANALSERDGLTPFYRIEGGSVTVPDWKGEGYRLPTEAEWEYACRGRNVGRYGFGDNASLLGEYAWFDGNSGNRIHEVREKRANGFGLFDMHGNVWEWCWDGYADKPAQGFQSPRAGGYYGACGPGRGLRQQPAARGLRAASGSVRINGSETMVSAWPEVRLVSRSVRVPRKRSLEWRQAGQTECGAEHPPQMPERAAQCTQRATKRWGGASLCLVKSFGFLSWWRLPSCLVFHRSPNSNRPPPRSVSPCSWASTIMKNVGSST